MWRGSRATATREAEEVAEGAAVAEEAKAAIMDEVKGVASAVAAAR